MMDKGDELPPGLHENADDSIRESLSLLEKCMVAPVAASAIASLRGSRLVVRASCLNRFRAWPETRSDDPQHASENRTECEVVERENRATQRLYLDSLGISGPHVLLAALRSLDEAEIDLLARAKTQVAHCPSSNLKLGSGIAQVSQMLDHGISVTLGADGAACNNRLDMFTEMRTAALLQKVLLNPEALPAKRVLRMATIDGAAALGLQAEIGSLELGKRADVIVVELKQVHNSPRPGDLASTIVYSAGPSDVATVVIDGKLVKRDVNY